MSNIVEGYSNKVQGKESGIHRGQNARTDECKQRQNPGEDIME